MTDKELKKLDRRELLEMILSKTEEVERLKEELRLVHEAAENREIRINECGSVAEAALSLNGIYEAAESAAQDYPESIKRCHEEQQTEQHKEKRMQEADDYWKRLSGKLERDRIRLFL